MACNSFQNNTCDLNNMWYESHKQLVHRVANELNASDKADELVEKFLCKQQKFKKVKDPLLPKKPKTSFIFFCNDNRAKVLKKNKDYKMGDVMKELGKLWKQCSEKEKEKYNLMAKEAKQTYEDDMETYQENNYYS